MTRLFQNRTSKWLSLVFFAGILMGCDKERRGQCEWYLVPDQNPTREVDKGYIAVCARNFVSNKQDCRLQTSLAYAKKVYKMTFRYTDLKVKTYGNPRTIDEIKFCTP